MSIKLLRKQYYENDIKAQEELPVHERKILENIHLSINNSNNLLQTDMIKFKLKGKMEIIEILKELNMITIESYGIIQKEAVEILNIAENSQ